MTLKLNLFQAVLPSHPATAVGPPPLPQMFWTNDAPDAPGGGKWWHGTIVSDRRGGGGEAQVLADPFGAEGLWGRFEVAWRGERKSERQRCICCLEASPAWFLCCLLPASLCEENCTALPACL